MAFDLSKSGLPQKIIISAFDHAIAFKDLSAGADHEIYGIYCFEDQELAFKAEQPSRHFAVDSVVHETLHAIFRTYALHHEKMSVKDSEEKIVTVIGTALTALLRQNPSFLKWLAKHAA